MTTEDEPMSSQFNLDRPDTDGVQSPSSKPHGGARILSFLLQALVMAVALSLFFLFAGLAALILLHLFVAGRALRRRRGILLYSLNSDLNPDPNLPFQGQEPLGLSPLDLKNLPSFRYSSKREAAMAEGMTSSDCAVCLEAYRDGDRCRRLTSCSHSFHLDCVDRWLLQSPACPICRRGVLTAAG